MKQRYDSYNPSGINWIRDIPNHWNVMKTSHVFERIGSGTTPTSIHQKIILIMLIIGFKHHPFSS